MKIVVLDGYTENPGDLSWEALEALGELKVYDRVSYVESPVIAETIGDADVAITNKTPISKATIDACPNLKAIAVLATGYNVVDYAYAGEKGIPVMNVPTYGTQIVGQYAVGLLLEICSHYQHHSDTVKAGKWENNVDWCYWDFPMIELYGKWLMTALRAKKDGSLRSMWNLTDCSLNRMSFSCTARFSRQQRESSTARISQR